MKKLIALTLCFACATVSAEEVRRVVDASPDGVVHIINTAGSIEVFGWSRGEVEVVADLGSNVEALIVERDNGEVIVKVKVPRRGKGNRSASTDLVVRVPENSSLKVTSVSADIEVSDVQGAQQLHSVSGDIDVDAYGADVDAETVSGDVEIDGNRESIRTLATTVSGDVEVSNLAGEIEGRSVSGDVAIVAGDFSRVEMNTTNGDLVFKGRLLGSGRMDVETVNGDVDLDFTGDLSARFDIETFNGGISSCFGPKSERKSKYGPGRKLLFNEGGGSGRVIIRTLNGDLRMCRD